MSTDARVAEMAALYSNGWSLRAIGDAFGLSGERVRQLMRNGGVPRNGNEYGKFTHSTDVVRVMAALRAPGVTSITDGARVAGVTFKTAKRVAHALGCMDALHRLYRMRRRQRLIEAMRALASRLGRTPGQFDLNDASSGTPSHMGYVHMFGSISAAQRAAGLIPNKTGGAGHVRSAA